MAYKSNLLISGLVPVVLFLSGCSTDKENTNNVAQKTKSGLRKGAKSVKGKSRNLRASQQHIGLTTEPMETAIVNICKSADTSFDKAGADATKILQEEVNTPIDNLLKQNQTQGQASFVQLQGHSFGTVVALMNTRNNYMKCLAKSRIDVDDSNVKTVVVNTDRIIKQLNEKYGLIQVDDVQKLSFQEVVEALQHVHAKGKDGLNNEATFSEEVQKPDCSSASHQPAVAEIEMIGQEIEIIGKCKVWYKENSESIPVPIETTEFDKPDGLFKNWNNKAFVRTVGILPDEKVGDGYWCVLNQNDTAMIFFPKKVVKGKFDQPPPPPPVPSYSAANPPPLPPGPPPQTTTPPPSVNETGAPSPASVDVDQGRQKQHGGGEVGQPPASGSETSGSSSVQDRIKNLEEIENAKRPEEQRKQEEANDKKLEEDKAPPLSPPSSPPQSPDQHKDNVEDGTSSESQPTAQPGAPKQRCPTGGKKMLSRGRQSFYEGRENECPRPLPPHPSAGDHHDGKNATPPFESSVDGQPPPPPVPPTEGAPPPSQPLSGDADVTSTPSPIAPNGIDKPPSILPPSDDANPAAAPTTPTVNETDASVSSSGDANFPPPPPPVHATASEGNSNSRGAAPSPQVSEVGGVPQHPPPVQEDMGTSPSSLSPPPQSETSTAQKPPSVPESVRATMTNRRQSMKGTTSRSPSSQDSGDDNASEPPQEQANATDAQPNPISSPTGPPVSSDVDPKLKVKDLIDKLPEEKRSKFIMRFKVGVPLETVINEAEAELSSSNTNKNPLHSISGGGFNLKAREQSNEPQEQPSSPFDQMLQRVAAMSDKSSQNQPNQDSGSDDFQD